MFEKLEVLNKKAHKELSYKAAPDYSYARSIHMAPLAINEIVLASHYFPILFSVTDPLTPYVLFSLENGVNRFVNENGAWNAGYVPFHIRRYPFMLSPLKEGESYNVCIDPKAPQLSSSEGEPLFDKDGKPGQIVKVAKKMLSTFQADMIKTTAILKELRSKDLLKPCRLQKVSGDEKKMLASFYTIDMDKVSDIDADTMREWVKSGLMGVFYAQAHSLIHLNLLKK